MAVAIQSEPTQQHNAKSVLAGDFQLALHTRPAIALLDGNWRIGRMGLMQFDQLMRILWRAYKADDPYAEWHLLKIYDHIQESMQRVKNYEATLQTQLNSVRGFKIGLISNPTPVEQSLQFLSPFCYMIAMLIEQIDYVTRQLLTVRRLGLLPQEKVTVSLLMRMAQKIFMQSRRWRYIGVTRNDIREKTPKGQEAQTLFGEIPQAILNKEIEFAFLPKIKSP